MLPGRRSFAVVLAATLGLAMVPPPSAEAKPAAKKKTAQAKPEAKKAKKPAPPPPLDGTTYDYDYDAKETGHRERAWQGRAFLHTKAIGKPDEPKPILVFLHGLNTDKIKYRWMGGGQEGDVRRIVAGLIDSGQVPPMIVAGPNATDPAAVGNAVTMWPAFDLDVFLAKTAAALAGAATIDRNRIIVAGHSGAGCNVKGGIATALTAKAPVLAGLVIDVCMGTDLAKDLAHLRGDLNVIVSWQTISWESRPFDDFKRTFLRESKGVQPAPTGLRELDYMQPKLPMPHDAMVQLTLEKWLPKLLAAQPSNAPAPAQGGAAGAAD